jgi:transcriptional regulator with XRE-family HTH domain
VSHWNIRQGLRECRELRGYSQTDLAARTGLKPSAVSHFETGNRVPSLGNLIRLADALDVSLDTLCLRRGASSLFGHTDS